MTGCGSRQQVEASDSIELLEPVSAAANTEAAAYRNIYEYKVLAGTVYPYIREYSFTQDVVLTKYEKAPGDRISKGDLLISADISSIEQQIKETEEKIEQLTQYSMLEQYDGDVLSNIIDKVLIYNDKDIEVVFKGENFIRNAV